MQWFFMVLGLFAGLLVGQSLTGGILGVLTVLAIRQAFLLRRLEEQNETLQRQVDDFSLRFEEDVDGIREQVRQIERRGLVSSPAQPVKAAVVADENKTEHEAIAADVGIEPPLTEQQTDESRQMALHASAASPISASTMPEKQTGQDEPRVAFRFLQTEEATAQAEAVIEPVHDTSPALSEVQAKHTVEDTDRLAGVSFEAYNTPEPVEPDFFDRSITAVKNWLFGGNTVLRMGAVLLFIGLAFLLRYASERVSVPIELRYAGVTFAAIILLSIGWRVRLRNAAYALVLQGTGVAVLYLTIFAAMRLHPLITPGAALILLIGVTICSAMLAVLQNAMGLAVAATLGGFAAPILTSTGSGNHVALFSYFALLNAGIFMIAWFKAWRMLNFIGFIGTFGIGFAWGLRAYTPELFATTEFFLILFFLMYVGIGLLFARRKLLDAEAVPAGREALLRWSARQADYIDGTVIFGPPLIGFGLQCAVIGHIEFGMAFSALVLGLFYLMLARVLQGHASAKRTSLLMETCLALGVIFGTLAIPLALDARWTSAAWAVEGAGIYWLGLKQRRRLARLFALLLQGGAIVAYLEGLRIGDETVLSGSPLGALMLGLALLFCFFQLRRADQQILSPWEQRGESLFSTAGLAFLYLIVPLCFSGDITAVCWALLGVVTLYAGLRLASRSFLFCAFGIQLLGGALFLLGLQGAGVGQGGVLASGWRGVMIASVIGLALINGVLMAARDPLIRENERLLRGLNIVLLLGLVLINLAVLFVLPWQIASGVWAGSGVLILWLSLMLQQRTCFYFGLGLQLIGGTAFLLASPLLFHGIRSEGLNPFAHRDFWIPAVLALAALTGAWRLHRAAEKEKRLVHKLPNLSLLSQALLVWGVGWWVLTALSEIIRFVPVAFRAHIVLMVASASILIWTWLARREAWRALAKICLLLVPTGALVLWQSWYFYYEPFAAMGWLGWSMLIVVHLLSVRALAEQLPQKLLSTVHVLGCWLLLAVLALELRYLFILLSEQYNAWRWLGWAIVPSAYLLLIGSRWPFPWPVRAFPEAYRVQAAIPVALILFAWFWLANLFSSGAAEPLPYLPLCNPLELGLATVLFALYRWSGAVLLPHDEEGVHPRGMRQAILGISLFALLTQAVCRFAHHTFGVPFDFDALFRSMQVQAMLSLLWTLCALALMVAGTRLQKRTVWMTGAALVGVVVIKLFFIELGNSGSLERIISFIGVGVLLLIVGYFSPLPPRQNEETTEAVHG